METFGSLHVFLNLWSEFLICHYLPICAIPGLISNEVIPQLLQAFLLQYVLTSPQTTP